MCLPHKATGKGHAGRHLMGLSSYGVGGGVGWSAREAPVLLGRNTVLRLAATWTKLVQFHYPGRFRKHGFPDDRKGTFFEGRLERRFCTDITYGTHWFF